MTDGKDEDPGQPEYWLKGLEEASSLFEATPPQTPSLDTIRQLCLTVLAQNHYGCAMTGQSFPPSLPLVNDDLQIVPIRPRALGGAVHVSNLLCLCTPAADAFRRGYITIGPNLELIADLSRIDPQVLVQLNPNGRLTVSDGAATPDPAAIRFHREQIFLSEP